MSYLGGKPNIKNYPLNLVSMFRFSSCIESGIFFAVRSWQS